MSYAVDVNVLLYASDDGSAHHAAAIGFLERCAKGGDLFCLAWPVIMGYLRIATHPAIFRRPLTHEEALRNVRALVGLPHVRMLSEEPGFIEAYEAVAGGLPVRGNFVPDAHLAALLRQHGVTVLYTRDRDFVKFGFLEVRDPFETRDDAWSDSSPSASSISRWK